VTGELLAGMWNLIGSLIAVPRRLIWDNESSSVGAWKRPGHCG
jgi:hypothetical protein